MDNPYQVSGAASDSTGYPLASLGAIQSLAATRPWVRLCSVIGFVVGAILLLGSVVGFLAGFGSATGVQELAFRAVATFPSLVIAVFSLILAGKLWGYGSAIARLAVTQAPADLDLALDAQRRFWRLAGIILIFSGVLMVLVMFLAFASAPVARPH